jgi:hypothetical protein
VRVRRKDYLLVQLVSKFCPQRIFSFLHLHICFLKSCFSLVGSIFIFTFPLCSFLLSRLVSVFIMVVSACSRIADNMPSLIFVLESREAIWDFNLLSSAFCCKMLRSYLLFQSTYSRFACSRAEDHTTFFQLATLFLKFSYSNRVILGNFLLISNRFLVAP